MNLMFDITKIDFPYLFSISFEVDAKKILKSRVLQMPFPGTDPGFHEDWFS